MLIEGKQNHNNKLMNKEVREKASGTNKKNTKQIGRNNHKNIVIIFYANGTNDPINKDYQNTSP